MACQVQICIGRKVYPCRRLWPDTQCRDAPSAEPALPPGLQGVVNDAHRRVNYHYRPHPRHLISCPFYYLLHTRITARLNGMYIYLFFFYMYFPY